MPQQASLPSSEDWSQYLVLQEHTFVAEPLGQDPSGFRATAHVYGEQAPLGSMQGPEPHVHFAQVPADAAAAVANSSARQVVLVVFVVVIVAWLFAVMPG